MWSPFGAAFCPDGGCLSSPSGTGRISVGGQARNPFPPDAARVRDFFGLFARILWEG